MKREKFVMKKYSKLMIWGLAIVGLFVTGSVQPGRDFDVPVSKYSFHVEIDGVDAGYFASLGGLRIDQEVIEYQDGDDSLVRKRPGRVRYGDIILRKGYMVGTVLNDWIEASRFGVDEHSRRTVSIILTDHTPPWDRGVEIKRWNCFGCFPRSWSLSGFNNGSGNVLTEEMVIVVEWFEEVEPAAYVPYWINDDNE
jgi:phage tail-like protein